MLTVAKNLYEYRELMTTLAWKNIALCYKQAYLGIAWAIRVSQRLNLWHEGLSPFFLIASLLPAPFYRRLVDRVTRRRSVRFGR